MIKYFNKKSNTKIESYGELINGQGLGYVAKMRYGLFPMSYNGCEMIAIYNLMLLEGRKGHTLTDICSKMYDTSCVFCGLLGSNVYVLDKYFLRLGMPVDKIFDRDGFFRRLTAGGYGIISFWNTNSPFDGVHTVCIEQTQDGYRIYNRSNKKSTPAEYKTADEVVSERRFMVGYCLYKPNGEK